MVGRAVVGALVLLSFFFGPPSAHQQAALVLGLIPFAVDALLWPVLWRRRPSGVLRAIGFTATLCDLVVVAAVAVAGLVPLAALPLLVVLPLDELAIRYRGRGAVAGVLFALVVVGFALLRQESTLTGESLLLTLLWLQALILVVGGVRGFMASATEWRASELVQRSERAGAMAGQLSTLLELSRELLEQRDVDDLLSSIAVGVSTVFGFKYVTICFQTAPGGDFERRILWGFPPEIVAERSGELVERESFSESLRHANQVVDHCYYAPAERYVSFKNEIYVGDLPRHAPRAHPGAWHERDSMAFVMTDARGEIVGYMSVDGPQDGRVPSRETMASMQIFVNMAGLAIMNADHTIRASERARVEEDARRLQMEFLSDVSHEIRAPLATIRGASALLRTHGDELDPERRREFLDALHDASGGLARMVEDLLLLSKLEAGHFRLRPGPVDLLAVVRDAVRAALAEHPGAPISLTLPPDPMGPVWADAHRLQQILVNLLSNALKYSPARSPVYVEVAPGGHGVRVAVADEGPGIPAHERARLFTRFGRLSNAKADSTGLGLYISKSLAQAMGGDLDCDSEPGAGSTFFLTLQYADAAAAEQRKGEPPGEERDDALGGTT